MTLNITSPAIQPLQKDYSGERGAALVTALIIMVLISAIAMGVLATVSSEIRIAGSDMQRTRALYAAASGMEKMTSDFSDLFTTTSNPTITQLDSIAGAYPSELTSEGFTFSQSLSVDDARLAQMRVSQGIVNGSLPTVTIPSGPFAGLLASVMPYQMNSTATHTPTSAQVGLQREINNYLIPLFQFGMFSDRDLELHAGPPFFFNGRVHANGNFYVAGRTKFLDKVTVANELVLFTLRNGNDHSAGNTQDVQMTVGGINVQITQGSVFGGPNLPGATLGQRGYFPDSPNGTNNASWPSVSVAAAQTGVDNRFGGQLLTRMTGAAPLYLPMQLGGWPTVEIIKRRMPADDVVMNQARYHTKAQIRILIDDETSTSANNVASIPAGKGLLLSTFRPDLLDSGKALWRVNDNGSYVDTSTTSPLQCSNSACSSTQAGDGVRGIKAVSDASGGGRSRTPAGAGIAGRILIEIVAPDGTAQDVTRQILSMGMTVGEPNAIVCLQRPLWSAFTQGNRDRDGGNDHLTYLVNNAGTYSFVADGEINPAVTTDAAGFLHNIQPEEGSSRPRRSFDPVTLPSLPLSSSTNWTSGWWNAIVPITMYNVREGWINGSLSNTNIYSRGMTTIVELNMKNLARWLDGVYDGNLLAGTNAMSANVDGTDGYILYVSDRRGDQRKNERAANGATIQTTNGTVDNEDIYDSNGQLNPGEDVINFGFDVALGQNKAGSLQKDILELPDPVAMNLGSNFGGTVPTGNATAFTRAVLTAEWRNSTNFFRRAVRLFNGEDLLLTGATNKLSNTKGITVSSENMVYVWGNYNTTGITCQPEDGSGNPTGSTLNNPSLTCRYQGDQIPTSIVADALFPLSKTWFDAYAGMSPTGGRTADASLPGVTSSTSVRAAVMAGNNLSALAGSPDQSNGAESRLSGGMHNYPRFLENWGGVRWNYVGSMAPLFRSTQALGSYNANGTIYGAPIRNWAFDETFLDPSRLPPGTPMFQYIEPTGFRQTL